MSTSLHLQKVHVFVLRYKESTSKNILRYSRKVNFSTSLYYGSDERVFTWVWSSQLGHVEKNTNKSIRHSHRPDNQAYVELVLATSFDILLVSIKFSLF